MCNSDISNCSTCVNSTYCLTCANASYLKSDNNACLTNCFSLDVGSCDDNTNFKCLKINII